MADEVESVFISSAHADSAFARALSEALEARGLGTFMVTDVGAGESFVDRLRDALEASSVFVVLISDQAVRSPAVLFEIGAAIGQGKKVVPVVLSESFARAIPDIGPHLQAIRATDLRPSDVADRVADAIEKAA